MDRGCGMGPRGIRMLGSGNLGRQMGMVRIYG